MGKDKAQLPWLGTTLLGHQVDTLRTLAAAELLVSVRADSRVSLGGVRMVVDEIADQGPLGGLVSLLTAIETSHLVVIPIDVPGVTGAVLRALLQASTPGCGAAVKTQRGWEPLVAVYPKELLPSLRERLVSDRRALQPMLDAAETLGRMRALHGFEEHFFQNLNTPADL